VRKNKSLHVLRKNSSALYVSDRLSKLNFFKSLIDRERNWTHFKLETDREIDTLLKVGTTICVHQKLETQCIRTLHCETHGRHKFQVISSLRPLIAPKNAMHSHFASLNSLEAWIYLQLASELRSTAFRCCLTHWRQRLYLQLTSGPRINDGSEN